MEKLGTHLEGRLIELHRLKDEGVKIIGYTPGEYMPEQLVYAGGAIPIGFIRGGEHEPVAASGAYIPRFIDTFCRAQIGYWVLQEEPLYQMPDLLVVPITDNNIRAIADCWNFYTNVEVFRFGVPYEKSEDAFKYYLDGLSLLKDKLEKFTGTAITEEKLKEEVGLFNKMRSLLKEISYSRKSDEPPITGRTSSG